MDTVLALWWADFLGARRWFAARSVSRLIVVVLFFLLFGGIAYGLYTIGGIFFRDLASFGTYGELTAAYIIHAAIVVILWLAVVSSMVAGIGMLVSSSPTMSYLLSLPVGKKRLAVWMFLKTVSANVFIMFVAFIPIMLAYAGAFGTLDGPFVARVALVLALVTYLSTGLGMLLALPLVRLIRGREYQTAVIGFLLFFLSMAALLRFVFPPSLSRLYEATLTEFHQIFSALPLNAPNIPTAWLAQTVLAGDAASMAFSLLMTAAVVAVSLWAQATYSVPVLLYLRSRPFFMAVSGQRRQQILNAKDPLLVKDLLSVFRQPSESGYGMFLISVAVFFFAALGYGLQGELRQEAWKSQLTVFSFVWLMFFATALLLRFVFPLMAREGKSAWFLFGLPVPRRSILHAKLTFAAYASGLLSVFAVAVLYFLPFTAGFRLQLLSYSVAVMLLLSVVHACLGAIAPNFAMGDEPEKVSTSGMGLLTLLVSILVTSVSGFVIWRIMTLRPDAPMLTVASFLLWSAAAVLLWKAAESALSRYEW